MKEKFKISAHVSQALGSEFKLSATRPSKNSLRSGIQSKRMKKEINILAHESQALGSHLNKHLEVRSSITKNE
jgi:hypothetical protein